MYDAPPSSAPRISVVICFLNGAPFLAEAIDSVLTQTFSDFELILVDDGSTDGSSATARAYEHADHRVRYVEHAGHANIGLSASRNVGIRAARAEIVALLDADDVWASTKLAQQLALLDAHPDVAMVCGGTRYWRSWDGVGHDEDVATALRQNLIIQPPEALFEIAPLGRGGAPCPSDLLLRKQAMLDVGCFEEHFRGPLALYEDQGFLNKLYLHYPIYVSSQIWLRYRRHGASISANVARASKSLTARCYFFDWYGKYLRTQSNVPKHVWTVLRIARLNLIRRSVLSSLSRAKRRIVGASRR